MLLSPDAPDGPMLWRGQRLEAGSEVQVENVIIRFEPEGFLACRFDRRGGVMHREQTLAFIEFMSTVLVEPTYVTWELLQTRPTLRMRELARELTIERIKIAHFAGVVGPVGRMIMGFFVRVVKSRIPITTHGDLGSARAHVLALARDADYQAPWAARG